MDHARKPVTGLALHPCWAGADGFLKAAAAAFARPAVRMLAWGALLELALLAFWAFSGLWRGSWRLIAGYFLPWGIYLLAAWRILRSPRTDSPSLERRLILAFSALFHLTLLLTPQPLSNDIYRYLWDGKLLANGVNPYTYPPAAPELYAWRDASWEGIFNRDVPTGYPPLSEAVFAVAYRMGSVAWPLRLFSSLGSLGATAFLMAALAAAGHDHRRALLFAWSPLTALEFGNSAHLDAYALLFLCAAFYFNLKGRHGWTAIALALGGLAKFYPALLAPVWGKHWSRRAWLGFLLLSILPWLPFLGGGLPFKGLVVFASRADFNNSLYTLFAEIWYLLLHSPYARYWARASAILLLGIIYLVGWRRFSERSSAGSAAAIYAWRFAGMLFGWMILLSPVVHPWYVCWMLVFTSLEGGAAWVVLSGTMIFARHVYISYEANDIWLEAAWTRWAVWLPFYAALWVQTVGKFKSYAVELGRSNRWFERGD